MKKAKIKLISGLLGLSLLMTACSAQPNKQSAHQDIAPEARSESSLDSKQHDGLVSESNNEESSKSRKGRLFTRETNKNWRYIVWYRKFW